METSPRPEKSSRPSALGNFLSGMETDKEEFSGSPVFPLETSLVEWKLFKRGHDATQRVNLGNFLSGMETASLFAR